jgi:hypothetical protein
VEAISDLGFQISDLKCDTLESDLRDRHAKLVLVNSLQARGVVDRI